ncbi:glutaredoxin family protein [Deltaproteobacteria bacterium PRO3]|nr:glutaredoxin family protein [Deltaproteobacteria bacterium PRO3]
MGRIRRELSEFFGDPFRRYLFLALALLYGVLWFRDGVHGPEEIGGGGEVHYFFHPQCPHCEVQRGFNEILQRKYPDLSWIRHDVSKAEEAARFREFARRYRIPTGELGIPATFFGDRYFIGFVGPETSGARLEAGLREFLSLSASEAASERAVSAAAGTVRLALLGEFDIRAYSLPVLAVLLGLVDGFNPCAMWVLVYLISLILTLQDRGKIWWLVGTFVLASGVLYFLFMTAWLNAFLWISYIRPVSLLIGLFALGIGIFQLRAFFTAAPLACSVGDAEKRKKTLGKISEIVLSPVGLAGIGAMLLLAFSVNAIEFLCSAGIPAIFTHLLAITPLETWRHYAYVLIYVFFFMLDDLVIFTLAALAVQSSVGLRYARWGRLVGGSLLLALGILLAFYPQVLR